MTCSMSRRLVPSRMEGACSCCLEFAAPSPNETLPSPDHGIWKSCRQDGGFACSLPITVSPCSPSAPHPPALALLVLTPADQAQLCQVVVDIGAEDLNEEKVEVTALQRRPGEAAEKAVVSEPCQELAGPQLGPTGETTVEQEGQVEEEQAAHKVHVQTQVDAEGLLKPGPAPEGAEKGGTA